MAEPSLVLPVTLDAPSTSSSLEQQCASATVSCMATWHSGAATGAALGCADGSLFLLKPSQLIAHIIFDITHTADRLFDCKGFWGVLTSRK